MATTSPRKTARPPALKSAPAPHVQSDEARVQENALHQGEMDLDAIQGTISSNDRHQQGKRDSR